MRKLLPLVACLVLVSSALASGPERLQIESIGLDAPVMATGRKAIEYEGKTVWQPIVPRDAVGWYDLSAQPGDGSNVVLMGHNPGVFSHLGGVHLGDYIIFTWGGQEYHYTVIDKRLVLDAGASYEQRVRNGQWILPTEDERLTIVTCWGERWRLVITAR